MDLPSTRFAHLLGTALTLGTLATLAPPCRGQAVGDANADHQVGSDDLAAIQGCVAGPGQPADPVCAAAFDLHANGSVDLRDLLGVQKNVTQNIRPPVDGLKRWRQEVIMVSRAASQNDPGFAPGGVEATFNFNLRHRMPPPGPSGPPCGGAVGRSFLALKQVDLAGSRVVFAGLVTETVPGNPAQLNLRCYREVKQHPQLDNYTSRFWDIPTGTDPHIGVGIRYEDPALGRWRIQFSDDLGAAFGSEATDWTGWRNEIPVGSFFYHEQLCPEVLLPGRPPLARRFIVFDARVYPPGLNSLGFDLDTFFFDPDLDFYRSEFIPDTIPSFETWDTRFP